jgi:hypothetical protein
MFEISESQYLELTKCSQCLTNNNDSKALFLSVCSATLCQKCLANSPDTIKCKHCNKEHEKRAYIENKSLSNLIQIHNNNNNEKKEKIIYDNFEIKDQQAVARMNSLNQDNKLIKLIENKIQKDYDQVAEQIEIRVGDLIQEIQNLKEKLLDEIKQSKNECIAFLDSKQYDQMEQLE